MRLLPARAANPPRDLSILFQRRLIGQARIKD
jgi:hypothetical protein